jgi:hypothetical protein
MIVAGHCCKVVQRTKSGLQAHPPKFLRFIQLQLARIQSAVKIAEPQYSMKKPPRKDLGWRECLGFAVFGLCTMVYGYGKILAKKPIYENWRGQDVSTGFVIFLGALFLMVAVFPWGRIHFLWEGSQSKRRR